MFLKKLNMTKKEINILTIATGVLIIGILAVISLMQPTLTQDTTDINFLGYQFTRLETSVLVAAPVDDEPFDITITESNEKDTYLIESIIRNAYGLWQRFLRNAIIFLYLLTFLLLIWKKKETQLHGIFKGILIGAGSVLLLFTLQLGLDVYSGLIKYGHDFIHLISLV